MGVCLCLGPQVDVGGAVRRVLWGQFIAIAVFGAATGAIVVWTLKVPGPSLHLATEINEPVRALERADLESLLAVLERPERDRILGSDASFAAFVTQEANNRSVLAAAYAQRADQNPALQTWMTRAAQGVLIEAFLNALVNRLDPKYPSADEARAYYTKNRTQFQIPARLHLWQIFLPATSATQREIAQTASRRIIEELLSNKADFASIAARYSKHDSSRINDGYMGLVAFSDLLPEIRRVVETAKEGAILGPIATADGIHIVKRGAAVAGGTLDYAQVAPQVVTYLKQQAQASLRAGAVQAETERYPMLPPSFAQWRSILQRRFDDPKAPVPAHEVSR